MSGKAEKSGGVFKSALAYATGSFAQQATSFILLFVLARFLTREDLGITSSLAAWSAVLSIFLSLQLHGAVSRFYFEMKDDPEKVRNYAGSIWVFQMAIGAAIVAVLILFPVWWERWQASKPAADRIPFLPYVPLALGTVLLSGAVAVPLALLQARQEARRYVILSSARLLVSVPVSIILVAFLGYGAAGMMIGQFSAALLVLCLVIRFHSGAVFPRQFSIAHISGAFRFAFPFVPHALAAWLLMSADRAILERHATLAVVGSYGLAVTISMCVESVACSINQAWQPYYYRVMKAEIDPVPELRRCLALYGIGYGLFCLAGILFSAEGLVLLLPAKHHHAIPYVAPLLLARLWGGWYYFVSSPLFYFQRTRLIPVLSAFAGCIGLGLNLWLVPRYGAVAAVWNSVLTAGLMMTVFHLAARSSQRLPFPWATMGITALCAVGGVFAAERVQAWSGTAVVLKCSILAVAAAASTRALKLSSSGQGVPSAA